MSKQFWLVLVGIVVILGGILFFTKHNQHSTASSSSNAQPTHHVMGTSPAGVTLVEYGDYECPVCGAYYPTVKQVTTAYVDKVVFQFRNLPLTSIHQNAFAGARAAEAAGLQNKYWEMHDLLYTNQQVWAQSNSPQTLFNSYATQLGLNLTKFQQDYASDQVNNAINADLAAFAKTGDDQATPTFYLDGTKIDNSRLVDASGQPSVAAFSKILDAEIAKKTGEPVKQ